MICRVARPNLQAEWRVRAVYTSPPFTRIPVTPIFAAFSSYIKFIMKFTRIFSSFFLSLLAFSSAQAADDKLLVQLATCEEYWIDWGK